MGDLRRAPKSVNTFSIADGIFGERGVLSSWSKSRKSLKRSICNHFFGFVGASW